MGNICPISNCNHQVSEQFNDSLDSSQISINENIIQNENDICQQPYANNLVDVSPSNADDTQSSSIQVTKQDIVQFQDSLVLIDETHNMPIEFMEFVFLTDSKSKQWIQNSGQVMFIMRGISGSGKSTLVDQIVHHYQTAKVCSADLFWISPSGEYNFELSRLKEAHEWAQSNAREACAEGQNPVIIDNTNVRSWEYSVYTKLAAQYDYLVIIVTPRTPWYLNVDELFRRNKHNVPRHVIEDKVKAFEIAIPMYLAWFVAPAEVERISQNTKIIMDSLFRLSIFSDYFKRDLNSGDAFNLCHEYWIAPTQRLHITCTYFGGPMRQRYCHANIEYMSTNKVQQAMGKMFTFAATGITITRHTIGLRIKLGEEMIQSGIWQLNSENGQDSSMINAAVRRPIGARAHITLGVARHAKAVQTGTDVLEIVDLELENYGKVLAEFDQGRLVYFGQCRFFFQFKEPQSIQALFTGYY